jgi:hypothetical protein
MRDGTRCGSIPRAADSERRAQEHTTDEEERRLFLADRPGVRVERPAGAQLDVRDWLEGPLTRGVEAELGEQELVTRVGLQSQRERLVGTAVDDVLLETGKAGVASIDTPAFSSRSCRAKTS